MAVDMTSFAYATKEWFENQQKVENACYTNRPMFAMIPKYPNKGGESYRLAVTYADIGSRSAAFATAYANKGTFSGAKFLLTWKNNYALADLDNRTLLSTQNDKGALMEAAIGTMESALNKLSNDYEMELFGDSNGAKGRVGSVSTVTLTLLDIEDIVYFETGDEIAADDTADGSSPRSGTATVTAVDRDAGTLTSDSNWTAQITGLTANDYLFSAGDTGGGTKIAGASAWVPTSTPTSTAFFGVNRTLDTVRLGGVRHTGTAQPIEEAVVSLGYKIFKHGNGMPNKGMAPPAKYRDLVNALGSKVQYLEHKVGEVGFQGVKVHAGASTVEIFPAWAQKSDRIHFFSMKDWGLYSISKLPQLIEKEGPNGNVWHYNLSTDTWQITAGGYAQCGCAAPGRSGVVTV